MDTSLLSLGLGLKSNKDKFIEKALNFLFSREHGKIIQSSDLDIFELKAWGYKAEILRTYVIDEFCIDENDRRRSKELLDNLFRLQVSKNRAGRTELLEAIKKEFAITPYQRKDENL
jgi:hypothetical protein